MYPGNSPATDPDIRIPTSIRRLMPIVHAQDPLPTVPTEHKRTGAPYFELFHLPYNNPFEYDSLAVLAVLGKRIVPFDGLQSEPSADPALFMPELVRGTRVTGWLMGAGCLSGAVLGAWQAGTFFRDSGPRVRLANTISHMFRYGRSVGIPIAILSASYHIMHAVVSVGFGEPSPVTRIIAGTVAGGLFYQPGLPRAVFPWRQLGPIVFHPQRALVGLGLAFASPVIHDVIIPFFQDLGNDTEQEIFLEFEDYLPIQDPGSEPALSTAA